MAHGLMFNAGKVITLRTSFATKMIFTAFGNISSKNLTIEYRSIFQNRGSDRPREDIQNKVPPKTRQEKRLSLYFGIPFLILLLAIPFISTLSLKHQLAGDVPFLQLFLNAFGVAVFFNVIDLLVLD